MNCILKHIIEGQMKGREHEEEDVSSYKITKNRENTGTLKRKH